MVDFIIAPSEIHNKQPIKDILLWSQVLLETIGMKGAGDNVDLILVYPFGQP